MIKSLTNATLIEYFKDAIREDHYNPSSESYNKSGYSLYELQKELYERLGQNEM